MELRSPISTNLLPPCSIQGFPREKQITCQPGADIRKVKQAVLALPNISQLPKMCGSGISCMPSSWGEFFFQEIVQFLWKYSFVYMVFIYRVWAKEKWLLVCVSLAGAIFTSKERQPCLNTKALFHNLQPRDQQGICKKSWSSLQNHTQTFTGTQAWKQAKKMTVTNGCSKFSAIFFWLWMQTTELILNKMGFSGFSFLKRVGGSSVWMSSNCFKGSGSKLWVLYLFNLTWEGVQEFVWL